MNGTPWQRRFILGVIGILVGTLGAVVTPVRAQYTANFQTNFISGVVSNWAGDYVVGSNTFADVLLIRNGGELFDRGGYVGSFPIGSNNSALVADAGSAWENTNGPLLVTGKGNSLVISNQGEVFSTWGGVAGTNNSIVVTGSGSTWNTTTASTSFVISSLGGPGNSVAILNGGRVNTWECEMIGSDPVGDLLLVSGIGSILSNSGTLVIGQGVPFYPGVLSSPQSLVVSNGGQVFSLRGYAGIYGSNSVLVTGSGSGWRNSQDLYVGQVGPGNSLVVSNGGQMINGTSFTFGGGGTCTIGGDPNFFSSSNPNSNSVVVTGTGSVWSNFNALTVGYYGAGNSLVIGNSGLVYCAGICDVGFSSISSNNSMRVTDGGVWRSRNNNLIVGFQGSSNSLVIVGGSVFVPSLYIGYASALCNNLVEMDSGSLTATGVLEVRNGTLVLNGGVLQVNQLVITNSCAQFVHTEGTLIAGSVVLDPNMFRITSLTRSGNDMLITWMMGPGQTNALQVSAGDANGGYSTNGFSDIFVVANNAIPGTVINYLDVGGATNKPARHYRVRLTP